MLSLKSTKLLNSLWPRDAIVARLILVNIGSGDGLLPDGNKPLLAPMLTYRQWGSVAHTQDQFPRNCSRYQLVKIVLQLLGSIELISMSAILGRWKIYNYINIVCREIEWKIFFFTYMKTFWHGNSFRITGSLWGQPQVTVGFPSQIASNEDLWCFLYR